MVVFYSFLLVVFSSAVLVFFQMRLRDTKEVNKFECGIKPFADSKLHNSTFSIAFLFPIAEAVVILLLIMFASLESNSSYGLLKICLLLVPITIGAIYIRESIK